MRTVQYLYKINLIRPLRRGRIPTRRQIDQLYRVTKHLIWIEYQKIKKGFYQLIYTL